MDEGGERCQSNPHCKRPQLFKNHKAKLTQVLRQLICYIHLFDISNKKTGEPNYEKKNKTPTKNVIWLLCLCFKSPTVCAKLHLTDKNHSDIDCQVDVKPQKEPLYTLKWSAFQSRHVTWRPQPWASPKCDGVTMETQAKMEAGWTAHSFWFHARRGWWGLGDDLQLEDLNPPFIERNVLNYIFFNHYLRRTKKKVVEAIHVSLVVSVQWRGRGVRLDWVG